MPDADVFFNILKVLGLFVGLSFIVFWVGLVWWVSQDILTRTSDKIIIAAAVAMTAILGPVGVMFYLIIRPKQTLKESYGEMMEHEMMLRAAASTICPMCEHMTQEDFVNCPFCGTVLKKQCPECHKLVAMDWSYCPYCGQLTEEKMVKPYTATPQPSTLKEIEQLKEAEALKQDAINKMRIEEAQRATFATLTPRISEQHRQKLSQAGQSALGVLKQAFTVSDFKSIKTTEPQPPTAAEDSLPEQATQQHAKPLQAEPTKPTVEPSKPATKKRAGKRAKK